MSERILLVTMTLGRWGETNGVEYTYRNLLPFFQAAGLGVDVVTYGPADSEERDGSLTFHVRRPRLPLGVDQDLKVDVTLLFSSFSKALTRTRYSIVQSGTPCPLGIAATIAARRSRCPLINVYHTALDRFAGARVARSLGGAVGAAVRRSVAWGEGLYFNHSDLILAPTPSVRDSLARRFRPPVEVLSRGIDAEKFSPARRRNPENPLPVALFVGRLTSEKNPELLVRIFAERPRVHLKVVGDGGLLPELRRSLPAAEFTGKLTGEALYDAYAGADFFVFPSRTDAFGNVVLQAMSSGLPVVVTDSLGPREQVRHGVNGFIAAGDEEFARAVDSLVADSALRRSMGLAARQFAETRRWEQVFRQLMEHYSTAGRLYAARPQTA
ncbi:glycosyltransferase [bacterium]|nr:glycosyltransferase [bacterium]